MTSLWCHSIVVVWCLKTFHNSARWWVWLKNWSRAAAIWHKRIGDNPLAYLTVANTRIKSSHCVLTQSYAWCTLTSTRILVWHIIWNFRVYNKNCPWGFWKWYMMMKIFNPVAWAFFGWDVHRKKSPEFLRRCHWQTCTLGNLRYHKIPWIPFSARKKTRSLNLHPEQNTETNKTGCQEVYNICVNIVCWNVVEVFVRLKQTPCTSL